MKLYCPSFVWRMVHSFLSTDANNPSDLIMRYRDEVWVFGCSRQVILLVLALGGQTRRSKRHSPKKHRIILVFMERAFSHTTRWRNIQWGRCHTPWFQTDSNNRLWRWFHWGLGRREAYLATNRPGNPDLIPRQVREANAEGSAEKVGWYGGQPVFW